MKHVRRRARFQQNQEASCHFLQGKTPKEIHALQNLEQLTKKSIEFRGEYVE